MEIEARSPDRITGRCMCGSVTCEARGNPIVTALCHCLRCQSQPGSAFSQVVFMPSNALQLKGATAFFADTGTNGFAVRRRFCPSCGSPIVTEIDFAPPIVFLKAGTLDDRSWLRPTMEMFVGRREPWVTPIPGVTQLEGNPPYP